ncbi:glutathione S-transferase family protein [Pseudogemmobacter blasticus]|uniref:Glutathione S-transferase n=1 Tax=Fuscovulum blasticum DSM 2131 TaxID=1188250 RepID=A0A2T4J5M2_FUSBL|nr:glutathione S-transferase family protein [Fuscovulum blasticum]PTE13190.1 glutathione S-transferase [Fuscovulum blasticum DSM 2131]
MTGPVTLTTYDWVPQSPRGHVRDLRVRWLLEEIGRPYRVETTPLMDKTPEHFAQQPFGQVPFVRDGDLVLFESGAILLHLARDTPLLPGGDDGARVLQWVIAGLNSVEVWAMFWVVAKLFRKDDEAAAREAVLLGQRLGQLEAALAGKDWLVADRFTVADLLMADILRIPAAHGFLDGLPGLQAYLARATGRPACGKALADQMAHWAEADRRRAA